MYYKEIMVISPKARHRTSFMDLDALSVSVFDNNCLRLINEVIRKRECLISMSFGSLEKDLQHKLYWLGEIQMQVCLRLKRQENTGQRKTKH